MRDTVNAIRGGVPSVVLVHEPFSQLAQNAAKQVDMPSAPILVYPRDLKELESETDLVIKAHDVVERAKLMMLAVGK